MNLTNYEYSKRPYTSVGSFRIHTLTDSGTDQYFDKESYVHKYLRNNDHDRICQLFNVTPKTKKDNDKEEDPVKIGNQEENKYYDTNGNIYNKKFQDSKNDKTQNYYSNECQTPDNNNPNPYLAKKINYKKFPIRVSNFKKSKISNKDSKYSENHLENLSNLKNVLKTSNQRNVSTTFSNDTLVKSFGFSTNNIPRVKQKERAKTAKFNIFHETLLKTCSTPEDPTRFKAILQNIEKLENIRRLPKIESICDQSEIKNVSIKIKNNKIMGKNYNPMNFYHDKLKCAITRNESGAIFQH